MRNYVAKTVDEYIESAEPEARPTLNDLRALMKKVMPAADESISWGVPFYKYKGLLAGFSVFKDHVSFGLVDQLSAEMRRDFEAKGYKTGKKIVQIKFDQKIPAEGIRELVLERAEANEIRHANR